MQHSFSCFELQKEIDCALQETDIYKKGKKWENVAEYVLNSVEGWKITGKRIRAGAQEIDLSVANISLDDELWQMGAYILIDGITSDSQEEIQRKINQNRSIGICKRII